MRINGLEVNEPNEELLVLPRKNGNVVFRAVAIRSFDEFEALVTEPKAPGTRTKDGFKINTNDKTYREQQKSYDDKKTNYLIINSLTPSNIEWSKVDYDAPNTWHLWKDELEDAGFNLIEINRITNLVMRANCLDEAKLEEARKSFLLGEALQSEFCSQNTEQENTQSGEPVKD